MSNSILVQCPRTSLPSQAADGSFASILWKHYVFINVRRNSQIVARWQHVFAWYGDSVTQTNTSSRYFTSTRNILRGRCKKIFDANSLGINSSGRILGGGLGWFGRGFTGGVLFDNERVSQNSDVIIWKRKNKRRPGLTLKQNAWLVLILTQVRSFSETCKQFCCLWHSFSTLEMPQLSLQTFSCLCKHILRVSPHPRSSSQDMLTWLAGNQPDTTYWCIYAEGGLECARAHLVYTPKGSASETIVTLESSDWLMEGLDYWLHIPSWMSFS